MHVRVRIVYLQDKTVRAYLPLYLCICSSVLVFTDLHCAQQRSTAKREPSECEDRSRKIPRTDSDVEESSAEAVPLVCPSELTGSHSFVFKTDAMDRSLSLDVHLHATHTYTPESASVIIVMHGLNRDVDRCVLTCLHGHMQRART
jgi:hypothetical protein